MTTVAERFEVERVLAERGPVKTVIARDRTTGERVVVKSLSVARAQSPREIELFERECGVLEHLDHAQVPRFITHAVEDGARGDVVLHLVMEHVAGRTWKELIEGGRSFDGDEVKRAARALAEILAHLHAKSPPVVHRDLKPSNVMVRDDGTLVLLDFGAVKRASSGDTTVVGTFGYMPPEQYEGRARPASDVYALGMTLIFLLTHKEPHAFGDDGVRGTYRRLANADARFLDLLDDMIALDEARRPRDGRELLARLDALDRPAPRAAPPASSSSGRPVLALAAASALALLLLVGAVVAAFALGAPSVPPPVPPPIPTIPVMPIPPPVAPARASHPLGLDEVAALWRCHDRTVRRIFDAEARYRAWLPEESGPPTCKERYITYGIYSAYEDAIAECARVAAARTSTSAGPALLAFAEAVAETVPLLEEASRYYDRKRWLDDDCAGARALHARLVPAFQRMHDATARFEDVLAAAFADGLSRAPPVDEPVVHAARDLVGATRAFALLGPLFDDGRAPDPEALARGYATLVTRAEALEAAALTLPPERAALRARITSAIDVVFSFRSTLRQLEEAKRRGRALREVFSVRVLDPWHVRGLADAVVGRLQDAFD